MPLTRLIHDLSRPGAYPHPVAGPIAVHQTHISVVFLAGPNAYKIKIKKPVNLGFLDFSTLAQRRHFCEEEVRLNRRLAPAVYLGVVPVMMHEGNLHVEGPGEVVEWAVKMQRLPEEATLQKRLLRGEIDGRMLEALARKIAAFHQQAETSERIAAFGHYDTVARNALENFSQAEGHVGLTVSRPVFDRLRDLTQTALDQLRTLMEARARPGIIRDTHGDLHLDHVYLFPDKPPPDDLVIIDCIEFNERFRFADPVADMAFVVMDLAFHGRRDLGRIFADAYFQAASDGPARALLPFYTAYRAVVRAKVEGFKLAEPEVPASERRADRARAQAHWLLALGELEQPARKPCLILVGGLPGSGKSTLARALAQQANFEVVRSDVIRKELAGFPTLQPATIGFEQGIYAPPWTDRAYAECQRRAEALLEEGRRVLVDASFRQENKRALFFTAGPRWGVPVLFLVCRAGLETIRQRLTARRHDASDADWAIYQQAAQRWEEPACSPYFFLDSEGSPDEMLGKGLDILRENGLMS